MTLNMITELYPTKMFELLWQEAICYTKSNIVLARKQLGHSEYYNFYFYFTLMPIIKALNCTQTNLNKIETLLRYHTFRTKLSLNKIIRSENVITALYRQSFHTTFWPA